jgi:hypothetical protein
VAAEHVEVPGAVIVGDQVHPRLYYDPPFAVGAHGILHRRDDVGVRQADSVDVRPRQESEP